MAASESKPGVWRAGERAASLRVMVSLALVAVLGGVASVVVNCTGTWRTIPPRWVGAAGASHPRGEWDVDEVRPASALRVLFIGNSFTHFYGGQALLVEQLALAAGRGRPPVFRMYTVDGQDLTGHWTMGEAVRKIRQGQWDYVVLQDHSVGPIVDREGMFEHGRLLDAEIRKAGARTLFFLTWARKDEPENQAVLTEAYTTLARELGAAVAAVGPAFAEAMRQDPEIELYDPDLRHPSEAGCYLAGCVFYATLYGGMPEHPLPGTIRDGDRVRIEVTPEQAAFLQRIAGEVVARFRAGKEGDLTSAGTRPTDE